jgi:uncharacterized membrane protein
VPRRRSSAPLPLLLIALLAIGLGSLARLHDLDRMVVWHDEVFSLLRTFGFQAQEAREALFTGRELRPRDLLAYQRPSPRLGLREALDSLMTHPEHGPLFYLTARLAAPAFPTALSGIRGTSAVLSLLLIPAVFWLAWELFGDRATAWAAAALTAVSPMHLLYAQEARQYALWTVLAAAASAALLTALRRGRRRDWALYALLAALGLYTHLLFALVLAAHAVYLLPSLRRSGAWSLAPARDWCLSVAAAALLFSPWVLVALTRADRIREVTAWMQLPVTDARLLEAWGLNLVRVFADLPAAGQLLLLGLIPLAWLVWRFLVLAPRAAVLFTSALFLTFAAAVLLPDLTSGGRRSLHPRYLLPAFLALQLAVAWVLAAGWSAPGGVRRRAARAGLVATLALGVWSGGLIVRADSWWHKGFSAANREIASLVNASDHPLVLVSDSAVGLGEAMSLAYYLEAGVSLVGEAPDGAGLPTAGHGDVFVLTPSEKLRAALAADYDLLALPSTWQWHRALRKQGKKGPGSISGFQHPALSSAKQTN